MRLTIDRLLQNCGAATVISQNSPVEHVDVIDVFGVGDPKQRAYVVEFRQAKRPSGLHVPHCGAQSNEIVGLVQTSGKSLHAVFDGQAIVAPLAVPYFSNKIRTTIKANEFMHFDWNELVCLDVLPLEQNWNVLNEMHITPDDEPHWLHIADAHQMSEEKIHINEISIGKHISDNQEFTFVVQSKIITRF